MSQFDNDSFIIFKSSNSEIFKLEKMYNRREQSTGKCRKVMKGDAKEYYYITFGSML